MEVGSRESGGWELKTVQETLFKSLLQRSREIGAGAGRGHGARRGLFLKDRNSIISVG